MSNIKYVRGTLPGLEGEHDIAVLEGDTHISKWVEASRRLDHDQSALPRIGALIDPDSVVYDVGAFIGDHTAFYASRAKFVFGFEAASDAFKCLCWNVARYGNVRLWNNPVGDRHTFIGSSDEGNKGARHLVRVKDGSGVVPVRLDAVAFSTGYIPTLVKLDIEGMEVEALHGATRILRDHHPTLVVEVNRGALERAGTSPAELYETIYLAGYRELFDLMTGFTWHMADDRPQFDVVCR